MSAENKDIKDNDHVIDTGEFSYDSEPKEDDYSAPDVADDHPLGTVVHDVITTNDKEPNPIEVSDSVDKSTGEIFSATPSIMPEGFDDDEEGSQSTAETPDFKQASDQAIDPVADQDVNEIASRIAGYEKSDELDANAAEIFEDSEYQEPPKSNNGSNKTPSVFDSETEQVVNKEEYKDYSFDGSDDSEYDEDDSHILSEPISNDVVSQSTPREYLADEVVGQRSLDEKKPFYKDTRKILFTLLTGVVAYGGYQFQFGGNGSIPTAKTTENTLVSKESVDIANDQESKISEQEVQFYNKAISESKDSKKPVSSNVVNANNSDVFKQTKALNLQHKRNIADLKTKHEGEVIALQGQVDVLTGTLAETKAQVSIYNRKQSENEELIGLMEEELNVLLREKQVLEAKVKNAINAKSNANSPENESPDVASVSNDTNQSLITPTKSSRIAAPKRVVVNEGSDYESTIFSR